MHAIDGMACAKRGCDTRGTLGLIIVGPGSFPTKWGRRWRYRCTVCGGTVSTHTGTAYSGRRCARREFDQVASLRVEGVSMSATARVTGHARHTIARWLARVSTAAKRFTQRMLRDFEIIELPADELCTFIGTKSRATWLCAAIEVCSRLGAWSVLGRRSSRNATAVLNDVILRGCVVGFPLIATDGFEYDVGVSERLFGSACVSGQVLKTRRNDRGVRVERRRRIGTAGRLKAALWESEDSETLYTSFVERLNLTIRHGSAYLRRRSALPCPWRRPAPRARRPLARLLQFHPAAQGVEVRSRDPDASDASRLGERANELERHLHGAGRWSGRPGSLLTLAPHRSGRAGSAASGSSTDSFATRRRVPAGPGSQAMATAIPTACLASSAIRCRDVETGPTLGVLAVFPSTGAPCRCPLPSTGSRGLNSPASAVL